MRSKKISGVVIKRANYSEADKIVTIFSREQGKMRVLAKGVRRIKSRRAPHLELFRQVEILLHSGKTFDIVAEAKTINNVVDSQLDLPLSGYLFYLCEVFDKILPEHQPHSELYVSLLSLMRELSSTKTGRQGKVKKFVLQLLWTLGYLPKGEYPKLGVTNFVESVVEKRIRSKKFLEEI